MMDILPDFQGNATARKEAIPVVIADPNGGLMSSLGGGSSYTTEEQAVRDGRAFFCATGDLPVPSGNELFLILSNPANSGVNLHIVRRLFSNNRAPTDEHLEYQTYANPTAVLTDTVPVINRFLGSPQSSAICNRQIAPSANVTMGGTPASGEVLPNGDPWSRNFEVLMPPGAAAGFTILGAGQNLAQAARVSIDIEWYEEAVS